MTFKAILLDQTDTGISASLTEMEDTSLPEGNVTVEVEYSSLNYKDAMVMGGIGRLVKEYPHVPGIDLAGVVSESSDSRFAAGDRVALTGWRVGEIWWGGYASKAKVMGDWLVKLPDAISTKDSMAIGTAGFTAMQALVALQDQGLADGGALLVTGASGGVGSSALIWASSMGYQVTASTGRLENADELTSLGATEVIDRSTIAEAPKRPLGSETWDGCIDAVGGDTLANILTVMKNRASVAACGLTAGSQLNTTVIPFLLRGVNLLGIDSVMCPAEDRQRIWGAIESSGAQSKVTALSSEVGLDEVVEMGPKILAGSVKGRTVVKCS